MMYGSLLLVIGYSGHLGMVTLSSLTHFCPFLFLSFFSDDAQLGRDWESPDSLRDLFP